jgi:hypothetical protein
MFNCVRLDGQLFDCGTPAHKRAIAQCLSSVGRVGASMTILLQRKTGALVFVYRADDLARVLSHGPSRSFLDGRGYDTSSPTACVASLRQHMEEHECLRGKYSACEFPHEVGLFLGYPYADVMGFIENRGQRSLCTGRWKVYSDEARARNMLACYNRVTALFDRLYEEGSTIEQMARSFEGILAPAGHVLPPRRHSGAEFADGMTKTPCSRKMGQTA